MNISQLIVPVICYVDFRDMIIAYTSFSHGTFLPRYSLLYIVLYIFINRFCVFFIHVLLRGSRTVYFFKKSRTRFCRWNCTLFRIILFLREEKLHCNNCALHILPLCYYFHEIKKLMCRLSRFSWLSMLITSRKYFILLIG